jgi:hypothetical protein
MTTIPSMSFVRLDDCRKALGTRSLHALACDLRRLSDRERRRIADLVVKAKPPRG